MARRSGRGRGHATAADVEPSHATGVGDDAMAYFRETEARALGRNLTSHRRRLEGSAESPSWNATMIGASSSKTWKMPRGLAHGS